MTTALILFVMWAAGVSFLLKLRFIRTRLDAYPLVAIWPILLVYVIGILIYEGGYRLVLAARRRWVRR